MNDSAIKYQLKPVGTDQIELEKTIYVIARCLSRAGFSITHEIYEQLLDDEKKMFEAQFNPK